jgi:RNA polymerase-binding transcription factor DksA
MGGGSKPTEPVHVHSARPKARKIPAKWRVHFRCLVELRDYLRQRKEPSADNAPARQTAFSATEEGDSSSIRSGEREALHEIEGALAKIQDGTYGICEMTGKPIEAERLEVLPWTRFTAAAERQLESEGRITLNSREWVAKLERDTTRSRVA